MGVKPEYQGKVIYATPGIGKTTVADKYNEIIDGDDLLLDQLKLEPGFQKTTETNLAEALLRKFQADPVGANKMYDRMLTRAKELAGEGNTVLVGSKRLIPQVDLAIVSQEDTSLVRQLKAKRIVAAPAEGVLAESRATETKIASLLAQTKTREDLPTLLEGLQKIILEDFSGGETLGGRVAAVEMERIYQEKLKEITGAAFTIDDVVKGDTLILKVGAVREVSIVSKTKNQIKTRPLGKTTGAVTTINRSNFGEMVETKYTPEMETAEAPEATPQEEVLAEQNIENQEQLTREERAKAGAEAETMSKEDRDSDFLGNLGCK